MSTDTLEMPLTQAAPVETKEAEPAAAKKWSLAFANTGRPIFHMEGRILQLSFARELDEELSRLRRSEVEALTAAFLKTPIYKRLMRLREQLAGVESRIAELGKQVDEIEAVYVDRLSQAEATEHTLEEFRIEAAALRGKHDDAKQEREVIAKALADVYRTANDELSKRTGQRNQELLAVVRKVDKESRERINAILDELLNPIDEAANAWTGFHSVTSQGFFNESILGSPPGLTPSN